MDSENYSKLSLQELYELYTNLNKNNNPEEAKKVFKQILLKEKKQNVTVDEFVDKNLAEPVERLLSSIIDALIIGVPLFSIAFIWFGLEEYLYILQNHMLIYILASICISQGFYLLINGRLLYKYGQSVGKKLLGIKIVDLENNIPVFYKIYFIRYFLTMIYPIIPLFGVILSMVNYLFIFRKDRRCIHDHLAGTKVIKAE